MDMVMDHSKDLPPLTLSNTSVSCLVTLIPVLVSMTSHGEIPSYEDETDKPAWWPPDIQWRNPKFYMQDTGKQDDVLKVLRKLVYSCYSYHGVEDLCRLEESPGSPNNETESGENMEIIQILGDSEDGLEESSTESEDPVYVCCFCLGQFTSHEHVSKHQSVCSRRFLNCSDSPTAIPSNKTLPQPETRSAKLRDFSLDSADRPTPPPHKPDSLDNLERGAHISDKNRKNVLFHGSCSSQGPHLSSAPCLPQKRPATAPCPPAPFVPTLKTRSQRKLDQIMQKHNMRQLMLKECQEMREVPRSGAWWVNKTRRKFVDRSSHPKTYQTQESFMSALGLAQSCDIVPKEEKPDQEVDLDCEIISIDGPLSTIPPPPPSSDKVPAVSPRSTRSLMSQLSRDNEVSSRRRLNFCFVEDEWADKEAINEGRNPLQFSLLTLEFSSPLGQRVRKYVRGEGYLNIIKDVESYCRTEIDEDSYSKLRFRASDFRVVFRKKRRASSYVHKYKFNKSDKLEFKKLLKTGLSFGSRQLQGTLSSCQVSLERLTESEIKSWTEEKKITINEEIVFDDDVCITQIDIPESRATQGFSMDSSSSPLHVYKNAHRSATSSPVPVPRANSVTDGSRSFSPSTYGSPPHVPNIFRNRSSHTSSPPVPVSLLGPQIYTHNKGSQLLSSQAKQTSSKFDASPSVSGISQQQTRRTENQGLSHLSGHACLSPSTFPSTNRSSMGTQCYSDLSNRRKQRWTDVRQDDGEGSGSNKAETLAKKTEAKSTMSIRTGLVKPASSRNGMQPLTRKLSNFDYFSIRDGRMQPLYQSPTPMFFSRQPSYQPPTVVSRQRSSATPLHKHQNQGPHQRTSQQNPNSRPSSSATTPARQHQQHNHVRSSAVPQQHNQRSHVRASTVPQRLQNRTIQQNQNNEKIVVVSERQPASNTTKSQSVKDMNSVIPSLMEHLQSTVALREGYHSNLSANHSNKFIGDDDVMEVIFIDDD